MAENSLSKTTNSNPHLLSREQAAQFLGVSKGWLDVDRRSAHRKLPFFSVGSRVLYHIDDLNHFLQSCKNEAAPAV